MAAAALSPAPAQTTTSVGRPSAAAAAAVSVPTGCQLSNRVGIWASVTPQRSSISELHRLCATSSSRVPEASE